MHTMTLYSDPNNAQSHRVRIVLGEKDLVFKIEEVLIKNQTFQDSL